MRISLNLATRPYADLRPALKRLRILMGVLVLLAGALGVGLHLLHNKANQARARVHALDTQIASIRQEQQNYQRLMQQPDNAKLLAQIAALNQLFDEKEFSWTLAMEDLETVLPGGVQVSTLEPVRAKGGDITLHLRVAGPRDRDLDLVKNLEHSRRFLFPRIVGENADAGEGVNQQRLQPVSASSRVDFDLLAEYNPPVPGEYKAAKSKEADGAGENPGGDGNAAHEAEGAHGAHHQGRLPYTGPKRPATPISKQNPGVRLNPAAGGAR